MFYYSPFLKYLFIQPISESMMLNRKFKMSTRYTWTHKIVNYEAKKKSDWCGLTELKYNEKYIVEAANISKVNIKFDNLLSFIFLFTYESIHTWKFTSAIEALFFLAYLWEGNSSSVYRILGNVHHLMRHTIHRYF